MSYTIVRTLQNSTIIGTNFGQYVLRYQNKYWMFPKEILTSFISLLLLLNISIVFTKTFSGSQLCQSWVTNQYFMGFSVTIIRFFVECGHKLVTHTHTHIHPGVVDMMLLNWYSRQQGSRDTLSSCCSHFRSIYRTNLIEPSPI
jgi:hypothetical protein